MNGYNLLVLLISLSAGFAYINHRYIKMPFVIGLFFLSTLLSLGVLSTKWWDMEYYTDVRDMMSRVELSSLILDIMLGFLLFAGSLHTNWVDIRKQIKPVATFALGGVILSTLIIAGLLFGAWNPD